MWGWKIGQQLSSKQQNAKGAQWRSQWVRNAQRIIILTDYSMSCEQAQIFTLGHKLEFVNSIDLLNHIQLERRHDYSFNQRKLCFFQGCFFCNSAALVAVRETLNTQKCHWHQWACWRSLLLQQKAALCALCTGRAGWYGLHFFFHKTIVCHCDAKQHAWGMSIALCNNKPSSNHKQQLPWEHVKPKGLLKFSCFTKQGWYQEILQKYFKKEFLHWFFLHFGNYCILWRRFYFKLKPLDKINKRPWLWLSERKQ